MEHAVEGGASCGAFVGVWYYYVDKEILKAAIFSHNCPSTRQHKYDTRKEAGSAAESRNFFFLFFDGRGSQVLGLATNSSRCAHLEISQTPPVVDHTRGELRGSLH